MSPEFASVGRIVYHAQQWQIACAVCTITFFPARGGLGLQDNNQIAP